MRKSPDHIRKAENDADTEYGFHSIPRANVPARPAPSSLLYREIRIIGSALETLSCFGIDKSFRMPARITYEWM